jgi:dolichyl-phosphate-mannose-protein mannosyltransferase
LPSRRRLILFALIGLAVGVRWLPATVNFVIGTDEALYLTLARNLAAGRGFTEDGVTPHTEFAPGYPFFAALIYKLGGRLELPAQINILLFGSLLVAPVYSLAHELADAPTARRAALLAALLPALALSVPNFEAPTEQIYSFFLWSGWLFLWRALKTRPDWKNAALAGACLGLAHITRLEGLLFIFLGALTLLGRALYEVRRQPHSGSRFKLHSLPVTSPPPPRPLARSGIWPLGFGIFVLSASLFALPYALYIHAHTGLWLAPKALLHQYHGEALRSGDPLVFEAAYADYEYNRSHLSELPGMLEYLWQNRADLPGFYVRNALAELRQAFTSVSFMLILWLPLTVWGAVQLWKSEGGPAKGLFLGLTVLPALIYPLSVVDPRYLLPLLPGAMIVTAIGLQPSVVTRQPLFVTRSGHAQRSLIVSRSSIVISSFVILFLTADLLGPFLIPRPVEYKRLGVWMREHGIGGGDVAVLARKRQPAFYAGVRWEWLPLADTNGMLAYAASHRAQYVVIDERTAPTLRPQLAYLLNPAQAPAMLKVVHVEETGKKIVLYQIVEARSP